MVKGAKQYFLKKLAILIAIAISLLFWAKLHAQNAQFIEVPGTVIDHSPAKKKIFIGSPSICILPNGGYIASHDIFGSSITGKNSVTTIFKSTNKGKNWGKIAEIKGQKWSQLFVHQSVLYLMGTEQAGGDILIKRSTDEGRTWSTSTDSLSGRIFKGRYHTAPTPVVMSNGRIWKAMEDMNGPKGKWGNSFRALMLSAPLNADLLKSTSWTMSNPMPYSPTYLDGNFNGWLEGNAVVAPDGRVFNILRTDYRVNGLEKASVIELSDNGITATFDEKSGFIDFPGGCKKFAIRYDTKTQKYWSLSNYIPQQYKSYNPERARNTLALTWSKDLLHWNIQSIVLFHSDIERHGFQYVDFQFDGPDLIAVSRTAYDDGMGGAENQHNANFFTFHRIKGFSKAKTSREWQYLLPTQKN